MDPVLALRALGGAARREVLIAAGVSSYALRKALASGAVERPYLGCYVLPDTPTNAFCAAMFRAEPTCVTALATLGLPLLRRDHAAHLAVPRDRARRATDKCPAGGVVLHRELELPSQGGTVAALAHAARCLDAHEWILPVDAALHRGLVTLDQVAEAGRLGRVDPRWTRRMVDPRAESPAESRARVAMLDAGLSLRSQVSLEEIGRVDFVVERRVIVETDGREYHSDEAKFAEDRRRDRAAIKRGFLPMRYPAAHALWNPESIAAEVRGLLAG